MNNTNITTNTNIVKFINTLSEDDIYKLSKIQRNIRLWLNNLNTIQKIEYNNMIISYNDIHVFSNKKRSDNDKNNKIRENIIGSISNDKIPNEYYKYSHKWLKLKKVICLYIKNLCYTKNIYYCNKVQCIHKAGRNHHYDFKFIVNDCHVFDIEFKFNASCVNETPQFVSPMKPSQYLTGSYEEYYYEKYFKFIVQEYNLQLPSKEEYLKQIHSPKPKCLIEHQKKYYCGCKNSSKYTGETSDIEFYEKLKKVSSESIKCFIEEFDINREKLTEYLQSTQKGKYYMLYKNDTFYLQTVDYQDYIIEDISKDAKFNRFIATTKSNKKIKILLRWKNGNGIAFPSFQIS